MTSFEIFASERLVYTLVEEDPEWDKALLALRSSLGFLNTGKSSFSTAIYPQVCTLGKDAESLERVIQTSTPSSLLPPGPKKDAKHLLRQLADHYSLALYVCIPKVQKRSPAETTAAENLNVAGLLCFRTSESRDSQCASVQLNLLPAFQRKGYGTEALKWMHWYGFQIARLHRLEFECPTWNHGARRLLQILGWTSDGYRREALWFFGKWHDLQLMSLLEQEWRDLPEEKVGKSIVDLDGSEENLMEILRCM